MRIGGVDVERVAAVILAGGLGTRLSSVVADRPKVLASVCGKPFLTYLLNQVAEAGVKHTVLCVGYRGDQIQGAFGESYAGMRLSYSQETALLGTGGALRLALSLIESGMFIAMNGDSYCEVDLRDLCMRHCTRRAKATLVLTFMSKSAKSGIKTTRYGCVTLGADEMITSFEEKGRTEGAGWMNAGIYALDLEMVRDIPQGRLVSLEREVFPSWVGQRLYGYRSRGRFLDIGTPKSYAQADKFFAKRS